MRKSIIAAAFLAILLAGCGADSAARSTQPEETTAGTTTETTQPETTADTTTESTQPETTAVPEQTAPATVAPQGRVTAIGDSVMVGAIDALRQEISDLDLIDAQGCRQAPAAIDILRQLRADGRLGDVVVIHIGNNGPFTTDNFDEMMQVLADVGKVLVVNLTVPPGVSDPIAVPNNAVLADGARRYPNTALVDWHAASAGHPEFFGGDGTHLSLEGWQAYAGLIAGSAYPAPSQGLNPARPREPSHPVVSASECPTTPRP